MNTAIDRGCGLIFALDLGAECKILMIYQSCAIENKAKKIGAAATAREGVPENMTKAYAGSRTIDGIIVTVDGEPLAERYDIEAFTVMGFEWTYEGKEPRQLALALLADHLGDDQRALALSERFMAKIVADLDNDWEMSGDDIAQAVSEIEAER